MNPTSDVEARVADLFAIRRLQEQVKLSAATLEPAFWQRMTELQLSVYQLDAYFESTWDVSNFSRRRLWTRVIKSLEELAHPAACPRLLSEIRAYEAIEASFRRTRSDTRTGIARYYYLKTCDVRLSRRLIEMRSEPLRRHLRLTAWNLFDLASELLDDITDLHEDLRTFNGNWLLFGLGGSNVRDVIEQCLSFLAEVEKHAYQLLSSLHSTEAIPIYLGLALISSLRATLNSAATRKHLLDAADGSLLIDALHNQGKQKLLGLDGPGLQYFPAPVLCS
jgi:hypothetical protein